MTERERRKETRRVGVFMLSIYMCVGDPRWWGQRETVWRRRREKETEIDKSNSDLLLSLTDATGKKVNSSQRYRTRNIKLNSK